MSSKELLVIIYLIAAFIVLGFVLLGILIAIPVMIYRGLKDGHRRRKGVKNG